MAKNLNELEFVLVCPLCGKVYDPGTPHWLTYRNSDGGEFGPVCPECASLEPAEMRRKARLMLSIRLREATDLWTLLEQLDGDTA